MQLARAIVFVADVERMQAFYTGSLGLAVIDSEPGYVQLAAGTCVLALHAIPPAYASTIASPPVEREDGVVKLAFRVGDIDGERARLVGLGVTMREVQHWVGIAFCDGIDPEGNVFQLTTG
ncbi:MAG: VOC family protein [Kofleriaceae bacterium]